MIEAEEAARLGLINRVVERDQLIGWAIETAERIAANSPSAVQAVKRQVTSTIADHVLAREGAGFAPGAVASVKIASFFSILNGAAVPCAPATRALTIGARIAVPEA